MPEQSQKAPGFRCVMCSPHAEEEDELMCLRCGQIIDKMNDALNIFPKTKQGKLFMDNYAKNYLKDPIRTLVEEAVSHYQSLPKEERDRLDREQAISWVRGNLALDGKEFTHEEVARFYDERRKEEG